MKNSLAKKFVKFSYGSWVGLILGLLITMVTTRLLPPDAFGKASLFDMLIKVGMIFTIFGTDQAFVRFFYEEQSTKRGALLYNSLKIPILNTIIMAAIVLIFYVPITNFLIGDANFSFAIIVVLGIVSQLFFRYGQLVIRMQQKGNLYSILQIFQKIFNLAIVILLFYFIGPTFKVLVFSKVITIILLSGIAVFLGKQLWSLKNLSIKSTKHSQKEIFRYGAPFVLSIFISWLLQSFDKIALRQWSDFNELGLYAAAMKLVALVAVIRTTFITFWTPVAFEKFENNPKDKDFFRYISIIVSFIMFLVAIVSVAGKDMIVLFLGSKYKEAADIMPFLIFMPIFYTISVTTVMGINFYKKTKWHIMIAGVACGMNIFANWLLVPDYGAVGASIATAFSFLIFFILRTQISLRYYKVNYPLGKIYLMTFIISAYAIVSIFVNSIMINILLGTFSILLLGLIYYKEIIYIVANRKVIFD